MSRTTTSASRSRRKSSKPKLWTFSTWVWGEHGNAEARTAAMRPAQARQFLEDTIRDMKTVLGAGKVYGARPEPEWLTEASEMEIFRRRSRVIEE